MLPGNIIIPNTFPHKLKEVTDDGCVALYAGIKSLQECDAWVKEYSKFNSTKWIVRGSAPNLKRLVCSKRYVCHHSSFKKKNADTMPNSKNCECDAKITISVKLTTRDTVKKHRHVREGLPALILINNKHSHSTDTADALSALPASTETRKLFETYFDNGMGIADSVKYHLEKLEAEADDMELANGFINPKYRTVRHWYTKWRSVNSEPRFEKDPLEIFSDWRSQVRHRFNRGHQSTTNERPLNELERELLSLTAKTEKQNVGIVVPAFGFGSPRPDSSSFDAIEMQDLPTLVPLAVGDLPLLGLDPPELTSSACFPTELDPLHIKCEAEEPQVQTVSQHPQVIAEHSTESPKIPQNRRICRKRKIKRADVTTALNDTYLKSIAESLKKISKIKKKNYKLRKLKLRLAYPDVDILTSSDSE